MKYLFFLYSQSLLNKQRYQYRALREQCVALILSKDIGTSRIVAITLLIFHEGDCECFPRVINGES